MSEPERFPCPKCGKRVTLTAAGNPRHHKCEPKETPAPAAQPAKPGGITPDMVVAKYIEDRDELSRMKKEYEEKAQAIKDLQAKREKYLQGIMNVQGLERFGTSAGTVFVDWKESAKVDDRERYLDWVHNDWGNRHHFLESRVSKTAVKQRHEDGEQSPPGVTWTRVKGVKIRRN